MVDMKNEVVADLLREFKTQAKKCINAFSGGVTIDQGIQRQFDSMAAFLDYYLEYQKGIYK